MQVPLTKCFFFSGWYGHWQAPDENGTGTLRPRTLPRGMPARRHVWGSPVPKTCNQRRWVDPASQTPREEFLAPVASKTSSPFLPCFYELPNSLPFNSPLLKSEVTCKQFNHDTTRSEHWQEIISTDHSTVPTEYSHRSPSACSVEIFSSNIMLLMVSYYEHMIST